MNESGSETDLAVRVVDGVDIGDLQLSTAEGYVLTRIDGSASTEELCELTGIGTQATLEILRKLRAKAIIVVGDGTSECPRADAGPRAHESAPTGLDAELDREELDGIDLKRDVRVRIRQLHNQLGEMNFFELLQVSVDADPRTIRRAYFEHSKLFHPDRYFSKSCGHYKKKLAKIFAQITSAYEALMANDTRESYRRSVVGEQEDARVAKSFAEEVHRAATSMGHQAIRVGTRDGVAAITSSQLDKVAEGARRPRKPSVGMPAILETALEAELRAFVEDSASSRFVADEPKTAEPKAAASARSTSGGRRGQKTGAPKRSSSKRSSTQVAAPGEPAAAEAKPAEAKEASTSTGSKDTLSMFRRRQITQTLDPSLDRFKKARDFFEKGKREADKGKALAATASFKLAMTYDPSVAEYVEHYERAVGTARAITSERLYQRGDVEHSFGRYEAAFALFAQAADTHQCVLYAARASRAAALLADLEQAKEYASKALELDGTSIEARIAWGEACLLAGEHKRARREAELAIKAAPDNADAHDLHRRCGAV
jgi:curved DNA-binding protein CbpA